MWAHLQSTPQARAGLQPTLSNKQMLAGTVAGMPMATAVSPSHSLIWSGNLVNHLFFKSVIFSTLLPLCTHDHSKTQKGFKNVNEKKITSINPHLRIGGLVSCIIPKQPLSQCLPSCLWLFDIILPTVIPSLCQVRLQSSICSRTRFISPSSWERMRHRQMWCYKMAIHWHQWWKMRSLLKMDSPVRRSLRSTICATIPKQILHCGRQQKKGIPLPRHSVLESSNGPSSEVSLGGMKMWKKILEES